MPKYPSDLLSLIAFLKKLPGVGSKTAERFAFQLLSWHEHQLQEFSEHLRMIKSRVQHCPECHCLMDKTDCYFCDKDKRDQEVICILACAKDAFAIEETRSYRGLYHVIGGLLSPLAGRHPEHLHLDRLKKELKHFQSRK